MDSEVVENDMKIPKYIKEALNKRAKAACALMDADRLITDFIDRNSIDVDTADYCGGVEQYTAPYESAERIYDAIVNHEK